jgi:glycosyltransferase involved in cell wall biosynthesis
MDLNHIDRPENSSAAKRIYYALIMRPAARKAYRVLTISEFSRKRIIDWAGVSPEHVINVGCGVDSSFHPKATAHAPGYPYMLCVSNRKKHKNEERVIHAFAQASIDPVIRLVFTGEENDETRKIVELLNLKNRVVFTGKVAEENLPGLYRGALALVFPSLYEGFGLPPLEAMACGTPVITSNITSLPEVVGDAAIMVNPLDVEKIAHAIQTLAEDNQLRQELGEKGLQRAKLFSWDKTAALTWKVLKEAAEQN